MDNIQKLMVGVLSVAGMLAMLVPSADSLGSSAEAPPPTTIDIPPPAQTADQAQVAGTESESEEAPESELSDDDVFAIGEGAIDGSPVGGSFGNSADAPPPITYDPGTISQPGTQSGGIAPVGGNNG